MADERSATREKTRSIATERERDDYVFEWTGVLTVQLRNKLTKKPSPFRRGGADR